MFGQEKDIISENKRNITTVQIISSQKPQYKIHQNFTLFFELKFFESGIIKNGGKKRTKK